MNYNIIYGSNHKCALVIQANLGAIDTIRFLNWNESDISPLELTVIVAVWKVKQLKPKQEHKPYIVDKSFCLN